MNLEEAKANIGKEVVLDESTKPYTTVRGTTIHNDVIRSFIGRKAIIVKVNPDLSVEVDFTEDGRYIDYWWIDPKHLKLKEQPMNYKIKVTPETSAEVQELFFELGYSWRAGGEEIQHTDMPYLFAYKKAINFVFRDKSFIDSENQEITLPQLRDMVVLKRNDVGDATHTYKCDKLRKYYIGHSVYRWNDSCWQEIPLNETYISGWLELIGDNPQMTWEDALRAVADGKDVDMMFNGEFEPLINLLESWLYGKAFRMKPKTIHIVGGDYTKEELLKIAGEME